MTTTSTFQTSVPASWDVQFILAKLGEAGVTDTFGYEITETELKIRVLNEHAEVLMAVVNAYQTSYLPVVRARLRQQVVTRRSQKMHDFKLGEAPLPLDTQTKVDLAGALALLREEPDRAEINWDVTGNLDFASIPRDEMIALAVAAGSYVQDLFDHSKVLAAAINAATTVDEALAIDLESGWPA